MSAAKKKRTGAARKSAQRRSIRPRKIDSSSWCYDMGGHLLIVHEVRAADGRYIQTDQFRLPWRLIRSAGRARA